MTEIPELEDSGSAGTQKTGATEVVPVEQESPLQGLPIVDAFRGLAATRSKSLGGEVGAQLMVGLITQLSKELEDIKKELKDTREELGETREAHANTRIREAVLQARVNAHSKERFRGNLNIFSGTALVSVGIELYRNNINTLAFVVGGLGALLVILGWFSTEGRTEK